MEYYTKGTSFGGHLGGNVQFNLSQYDKIGFGTSGSVAHGCGNTEGNAVVSGQHTDITTQIWSIGISYNRYFPNNMRLNISGDASYYHSFGTGLKNVEWTPEGSFSLYYPINQKNTVSVSGGYQGVNPSGMATSNNIVQENEIIRRIGNPDYRLGHSFYSQANYTFSPSPIISLAAMRSYNLTMNLATQVWYPADIYRMIQTWVYTGRDQQFFGHLAATLKLFNRNLHIKPSGDFSYYRVSHAQNQIFKRFSYGIDASYYFGDFWASASSNSKSIGRNRNMTVYIYPDNYSFKFGYVKDAFSASVTLYDIFRKNADKHSYIHTPYYNTDAWIGGEYKRSISISLVYSFDFGKKVYRQDEI